MPSHVRYPALGILVTLIGSLLVAFTGSPAHAADRDCADFPSQRAAQIFFLRHGGPQRDPHRLDGNDNDGRACESNPAPTYYGSVLPGGGAAPSKPPTVRKSTVRLRTAPARAIAGERVRHRVQVLPRIKRKVVLQRARVDGGWKRVVSGQTTKAGRLVVRTKTPAATTTYRAIVVKQKVKKKWYSAASSPRRRVVTQRQSVTLNLPLAAVTGARVSALVDVTPVRRGRLVVLQRLTANGWRIVDDATESRHGRARFQVVAPRRAGEFTYRAVVQPRRGAKAAGSSRETLRVARPTPDDTTPPPIPTGLDATAGNATVELTWNPVTATDLSGYEVYLAASADGPWTSLGTVSGETFVVPGLENGTRYFFSVAAVDVNGNPSRQSAHSSATPVAPDETAPAVPVGLAATPGDERVTLSWEAVSAGDLAGYRVYVREGADGEWQARPETTPATSRAVEGLTNGTEYSFAVTAVDTSGNESDRSSVVSATPVAPAA
jgi:chitodextrinase